jgi:predicted glycoside hydrolase/deacetylase ChbG (UPF0249 family)
MTDESRNLHAHSRIPDFATREEEAEWWDTHSFVDFHDELEPVVITFAEKLSDPTALAGIRDRGEDHAKPRE